MRHIKIYLILIILLILPAIVFAGESAIFTWNPNTETDLAGYRLYQSAVSGQYTFGAASAVADITAGTETVSLENVPDGTWYWVLTAYDASGHESGPSNEVTLAIDTTPPDSPTGLSAIIQRIVSFFRSIFGGLRLG
ncbi:MAG: hypothetical protein APR55_07060 [Methanolinea sp. SDB]|nr:MAG: hypothetical protein APR55_07060 [Methanolinea sp. SDB]